MNEAKLTTTNIAVDQLKHLRKLSTQHGLKQVEFINASIDYFRKTGINPSEEIYSPREEIAKLAKRVDEVIRFLQTQEKHKLSPLLERLVLLDAEMRGTLSSLIVKADLKTIELELHQVRTSVDRSKQNTDATSKINQDAILASLKNISELHERTDRLIVFLFEALRNQSITKGFKEVDIKNFENALLKIR